MIKGKIHHLSNSTNDSSSGSERNRKRIALRLEQNSRKKSIQRTTQPIRVAQQVSKRFVLARRRGGRGWDLYTLANILCVRVSSLVLWARRALRLRLLFPGKDGLPDWLPFSVRDRRGPSFLVKKITIFPWRVNWKIEFLLEYSDFCVTNFFK